VQWTLRNYDSPEPIILSVGEEDEVTIRDAALAVVSGMGYTGEVVVATSEKPPRHLLEPHARRSVARLRALGTPQQHADRP